MIESTERIIGTPEGVFVSRDVRRVPEGERYDSQLISTIKGLPRKLQPSKDGDDNDMFEMPASVDLTPDTPLAPRTPTVVAEAPDKAVRKYYITSADLARYGRTEGCPACLADAEGLPRQGVSHTPECRARIELAVENDKERNSRLMAQRARELEKRPAEAETTGPERRVALRTPEGASASAASSAAAAQPQGTVAAPRDRWEEASGAWTRVHSQARRALFTPEGVTGRAPHMCGSWRRTAVKYQDGTEEVIIDQWRNSSTEHRVLDQMWTGTTTFHENEPQ